MGAARIAPGLALLLCCPVLSSAYALVSPPPPTLRDGMRAYPGVPGIGLGHAVLSSPCSSNVGLGLKDSGSLLTHPISYGPPGLIWGQQEAGSLPAPSPEPKGYTPSHHPFRAAPMPFRPINLISQPVTKPVCYLPSWSQDQLTPPASSNLPQIPVVGLLGTLPGPATTSGRQLFQESPQEKEKVGRGFLQPSEIVCKIWCDWKKGANVCPGLQKHQTFKPLKAPTPGPVLCLR
ncbi:hypothetical protein P7K49_030321 [Saguinus oedipus]|uniref:Uncharacterized protein n=1 Tax=Saguinus oedipus TaxID=9490 RepID=A0ABQ9U1T8_SAGOE|nr:hypothetical protein P7K49_030321 [Saguinus oedipus]